jgi:hypothetical protein
MAVTTIQVTGLSIQTLDGTPLNGFVIFSAPEVETIPGVIFAGSGDATVRNGVMDTITLPTTDSTIPPFTYTIKLRISGPDGDLDNQVYTGVPIPSTLGATVDLSMLI